MSFEDALATQPQWVRVWVLWMAVVTVGSLVVLLFSKNTRRDALVVFALNAGNFAVMQWLYAQVGYVRLLGLPHIVFWTPLAAYLVWRLRTGTIRGPFRQVMWVLLVTISVSLIIDYVDVARYLLGERADLARAAVDG